eukprot:SAG31_NODE_15144_length_768_cov_0.944694_2_plen_77_part_01
MKFFAKLIVPPWLGRCRAPGRGISEFGTENVKSRIEERGGAGIVGFAGEAGALLKGIGGRELRWVPCPANWPLWRTV